MASDPLADIRAREAAATPGPWRWYGNTDTQEIALTTVGMGTSYVMRFARWGMRNAKPLFAVGRRWGPDPDNPDRFEIRPHGRMTGADLMPVYEVAPGATDRKDDRVYRADLIGIRHPDAEFIEHARADIPRLLAFADELLGQIVAPSRHHDPAVSCNCGPDYPPGTAERCEYALLSDAVIAAFNPPDEDAAQVAVCMVAVGRAAAYIARQDCACTPGMVNDGEPCARCEVLGQLGGKPVQR